LVRPDGFKVWRLGRFGQARLRRTSMDAKQNAHPARAGKDAARCTVSYCRGRIA
jgi:hypothetical protein